jgi:hypothetical protein
MALEIASIRTRVLESGLFTQVHDVVSLADAIRNPGAYAKQAFLAVPRETAEPNRRTGGPHLQRVTARVAVSFNLQSQSHGQGKNDTVEAMRSTLKAHLAGWTPTGAETAFDYAYSDIQGSTAGFIWVNVFFDCRYLFTAA